MTTALGTAVAPAVADGLPPTGADVPLAPLARMLATARSEIDRHLNSRGTCTWCGRPWPCSTACLAEFALSAF
jgi:hypothetical protein